MFSVVIPLYNKEQYICRAVDSVLSQTYEQFELIVVDDGSTDRSAELVENIKDDRVRVIRQDNQGEGPARNSGVLAASNHWVAFLDADDAWLPDHLREISNIINRFDKVAMVSTSCIEITDSSKKVNIDNNPEANIRVINYFIEAAKDIGIVNSTSVAIKKEVFEEVGGFSNFRAGTDLEYWARVALKYSVAKSNRITCCYYRNTGGVMEELSRISHPTEHMIQRLNDLSPSVSYLLSVAKKQPNILKRHDVVTYINSRLYSAMRQSLYAKHIEEISMLYALCLKPSSLNMHLLGSAAKLHPAVLLSARHFSLKFKRLINR